MGRPTEFARLDRGGAPGEKEGVQGAALSRGPGSLSPAFISSLPTIALTCTCLCLTCANFFEDQLA